MADFKVDILDFAGEKAGSVTLPAALFDVDANVALLHQVVNAQLAAARQGTHKVKTRGEVRGGGIKPFKQKGTGRARQGSIRAPHFTGGGIVHGPTPRDYSQRTPKKMIAAALRQSLSDRARNERLHVVKGFVAGEKPSTKLALSLLGKVNEGRRALVVLNRGDDTDVLSLRNIPQVHTLYVDQLNTYDVLCADDVIFSEVALKLWIGANTKEETK
ncbi:50S ribosomal protein L4 [Arcanobacterium hippocoleae]|uniref:Large ribosomal subunit protein uL4 n=1 Tax=Arcanobacterium hippocoleae TaxID=149017 RepID=A0ABU1T3S6_9ACTO|nr:50S ribosomal protein L4 [Arcanobacterium hippocoleae]MDR6940042.1 large subunit ribosomal protein L4 [Arcanobacterium hippocoleae]